MESTQGREKKGISQDISLQSAQQGEFPVAGKTIGRRAGRSWERAWSSLRSAQLSPGCPGWDGWTDCAAGEGRGDRPSGLKAERWARRCWAGRESGTAAGLGPADGRRQVQAAPCS